MDKEMIERCVVAARARRVRLISMPLDRCYEDIVLAVIKAMREPTQKMLSADEVHPSCHTCGGHKEGYQRMICAILDEDYHD